MEWEAADRGILEDLVASLVSSQDIDLCRVIFYQYCHVLCWLDRTHAVGVKASLLLALRFYTADHQGQVIQSNVFPTLILSQLLIAVRRL